MFTGTKNGSPVNESLHYGVTNGLSHNLFIPCGYEGSVRINVQWGFTPTFSLGKPSNENPTPLQDNDNVPGESWTTVINVVRANLPVNPTPFHINLACMLDNVDVYAPPPPPDCVGCDVAWYNSLTQDQYNPERIGNPFPSQTIQSDPNLPAGVRTYYFRYTDGCNYYSTNAGLVVVVGVAPPPSFVGTPYVFSTERPLFPDCNLPQERYELSYDDAGYIANLNAQLNSYPETAGSSFSGRVQWRGDKFITETVPPSDLKRYVVCREDVKCNDILENPAKYFADYYLSADIQINNPENPSETYYRQNFVDHCEYIQVQTEHVGDKDARLCRRGNLGKKGDESFGFIEISQDKQAIILDNNYDQAGIVEIFNIQGWLIFKGEVNGESDLAINKNNFKQGLYIIRTQVGNEIESSKIFISN